MSNIIISGDGSGDFNCGKTDAQVQINKAFEYQKDNPEDSIFLKGPFKYVIKSPILTSNVFELTGDKDAVITLADNVNWAKDVPLMKQKSVSKINDVDIKIHGFTIDGNWKGNTNRPRGRSYHTFGWLYYGDIEIFDMTLQNGHNDGFKVMYSDVNFHHNTVTMLGHEALYAIKCNRVSSKDNKVRTKTNSGTRVQDSNHVTITGNEIWTVYEEDAGGPGIQVQFSKSTACPAMNDVDISNNIIHDTYGPGIWLVAYGGSQYSKEEACGVVIEGNKIYRCGTHHNYDWMAGIVTSGFYDTLIENNVIEDCYGAGVLVKNACGLKPNGQGKYNTIVKDNLISGTVKMKRGTGGQGIRNETPDVHTVESEGNHIWGNIAGPYYNVTSKSDILHAPATSEEPSYIACEVTEEEYAKITELYANRTIFRRI
jgi:hypothetical protein